MQCLLIYFYGDMPSSMLIVRSRNATDCDGSSDSQVRIPKLSVSALKFSQELGVPLSVHMPNMLSMNRLNISRLFLYFGIRVPTSCTA